MRGEFWENLNVPGSGEELNVSLERAGRVADFLEFGELMCLDALERRESCGGHFREDFPSKDEQVFGTFNTVVRKGPDGKMQLERVPLTPLPQHLKDIRAKSVAALTEISASLVSRAESDASVEGRATIVNACKPIIRESGVCFPR